METEKYYRLALNFLDGVGNSTLKEILRITKSAEKVFTEPEIWRSHLNKRGKRDVSISMTDNVKYLIDKEMGYIEKYDVKVCHWLDADYPYRLRRCGDAPLCMFYMGDIGFGEKRVLALVGTRNVSQYGRKCVAKFIGDLCGSEIITVSGLAYGVDTCVHEESIDNGLKTVAVLGCGLRTVYPSSNERLARRVVESGGAVVSEFPFETTPERQNFPKRNRIIAGLSDAVVVMESALKGGSIITAHIAHSYDRDVFAVPGPVFEENSAGCHNLIRKNVAAMATSGTDIIEMMNWDAPARGHQTELFVELSEDEESVFSFLRDESRSIDEISEHCGGFTPSKLAGLLLTMELKGVIVSLPGKRYAVKR